MQLSLSEALTLLIAVYGASLSTVLAVREIRKERRRVAVTCRVALVPAPVEGVWKFVDVSAVNVGHRPVEIRAAGLNMSNGHQFTQLKNNLGPIPLPKKLEDGDSVSVMFDYVQVEKAAREHQAVFTSAFVRDAEGNEYESGLPKVLKERKLAK